MTKLISDSDEEVVPAADNCSTIKPVESESEFERRRRPSSPTRGYPRLSFKRNPQGTTIPQINFNPSYGTGVYLNSSRISGDNNFGMNIDAGQYYGTEKAFFYEDDDDD